MTPTSTLWRASSSDSSTGGKIRYHGWLCSSVMEFRLADFFSEKNIVGSHGVPDPPSLAQMTFTQCTSMSELKIDPGAPTGGQI